MVKNNRLQKKNRVDFIIDILFLSPQLILYTVFTILPFFIAIPIIFTNKLNLLNTDFKFIGFANFTALFKEPLMGEFMPAVGRTAMFTIVNYAMVFIYGLIIALVMYEYISVIKNFFFTVVFLPSLISGLGVGLMMIMLLSRDTGTYNLILLKLGIIKEPIDIYSPVISAIALPIMVGWRNAGFNMAFFLSGLLSIPYDTIEASRIDGAGYLKRLRYIYLPQIVPTLSVLTIMCLLGSFGIFDEAVGFGGMRGNKNVEFLAVLLYKLGFGGSGIAGNLAQAVTMSLVVYMPLILIAFYVNRIQKKLQYN